MPRFRALPLAFAVVACLIPATGWADAGQPDGAGAYLAAREAAARNDFAAAVVWFDKALLADATNPTLLEGAVTAHLALGDIDGAAARGHELLKSGAHNQIAYLAVLAANAKAEDYATILTNQAGGNTIGGLIDKLIVAWAKVGTGKMTDALTDFDAISKDPGTAAFGLYHKALALASTGDFEGADKLLSGPDAQAVKQLRRAVIARAEILSQLERDPEAVALIDSSFGPRLDPVTAELRRRLAAGEPVAFDVVRSARDGLAEVFFTLATALGDQTDQTYILLYTRVATHLRPDLIEAQLMSANLLEKLHQFDQASAVFAAIPPTDPAYVTARIGQADATIQAGKIDDAVTQLQALAKELPADLRVHTALGDALHRQGHCDLAVKSYDAAIALVPNPEKGNWPLFYKRAGCEVDSNWPAAEADFRKALDLDPTEPRLLNELGYGYVDRGEHLDEALGMIQRAVAASPDTGYIVDSLGWAYFRMARYQDAVAPQEKAALLMPVDPIVTDHLGDVYWMVGRKREAQFQWHRALSYGPDDKAKARIQRKLAVGLDVVLQEEKATGTNGN